MSFTRKRRQKPMKWFILTQPIESPNNNFDEYTKEAFRTMVTMLRRDLRAAGDDRETLFGLDAWTVLESLPNEAVKLWGSRDIPWSAIESEIQRQRKLWQQRQQRKPNE